MILRNRVLGDPKDETISSLKINIFEISNRTEAGTDTVRKSVRSGGLRIGAEN